MNEQQRLTYLRSMGYQAYYPRVALPGAKASPPYVLPDEQTPVAEPALTAPTGSSRKSAAVSPLRPAPAAEKPSTGKAPAAALTGTQSQGPVPEVAAQADTLRFKLRFFAISPQLAVISEEPFEWRGKQSKEATQLLQAILRAILPGQAQPELNSEAFEWPLADDPEQNDPKRLASLALHGFINQRQSQDGFDNLLVFTAQIADLFVAGQAAEDLGDVGTDKLECNLTLTHSLQSMLVHPLLKRDVWSHLQPLRRRIAQ